jgi:glucose/arabinose dehydrogenase
MSLSVLLLLGLMQGCGGGGGGSGSAAPPVVNPPPEEPPPEEPPPEEPPPEEPPPEEPPPEEPPPEEPPPVADPAIALQRVYTQLDFVRPVALLQAPLDDNRWFVVEQAGVVRAFDNDPAVAATSVFIDISDRVRSGGEAGLLGMALHPDFAANGEVILSYTGDPGGVLTSFISRFRSLDGGQTLDPGSEEILLQVIQDFGNHNGGNIAFGPDGFLYIGLGDGGSGNDPNDRAQDTTNLLGAMLRIDVDGTAPYAIPAGNPFAANPHCVQGYGADPCPEIFAWGLRNPWRWSFDSDTGLLWAGDVGQSGWEEVDIVRVGENYGWRIREGARCNAAIAADCDATGLTDPFWEYDHSVGSSITGGFVYRGSQVPNLAGYYVFGDFVSGRIWGIPVDGSSGALGLLESSVPIAAFGQDNAGELYVVGYSGDLYRIIDGS